MRCRRRVAAEEKKAGGKFSHVSLIYKVSMSAPGAPEQGFSERNKPGMAFIKEDFGLSRTNVRFTFRLTSK